VSPPPPPPPDEEARAAYLAAVAQYRARHPLLGTEVGYDVDAGAFVQLDLVAKLKPDQPEGLTDTPERGDKDRRERLAGTPVRGDEDKRERHADKPKREDEDRPVKVEAVLSPDEGVWNAGALAFVLGPPGSGKTTFLRHVLVRLARWENEVPILLHANDLLWALRAAPKPFARATLGPLLAQTATRYATSLFAAADATRQAVADALHKVLRDNGPRSQRFTLLVDALDEVST
jgi:hypothetical protein